MVRFFFDGEVIFVGVLFRNLPNVRSICFENILHREIAASTI